MVFYVAPSLQSWGQYIEVAPNDWATYPIPVYSPICSKKTGIVGSFSEAVGAGRANTAIMTQQCTYDYLCGVTCGRIETQYRGNGFTDWYAPSIGEARMIYTNLFKTKKMSDPYGMITTSNLGSDYGILVTMDDGMAAVQQKIYGGNWWNVPHRPVRAFRANTCANGGLCQLGDKGPGGGTIFYVGDFVNSATGEMNHYLELAPANWASPSDPVAAWGCSLASNTVADAIGEGEKNTNTIIAGCSTSTIAAARARAYRGGGQTDWSLPSYREMHYLCLWATDQPITTSYCQTYEYDSNGVGRPKARSQARSDLDWTGKAYWTSSQNSSYPTYATTLTASNQNFSSFGKTNARDVSVRPIRSF
jgi:hypothetical protein